MLLAACSADDYKVQGLPQGVKEQADSLRDVLGQPVGRVVAADPNLPYPGIPDDPRPIQRSAKLRNDMIHELADDNATAGKIAADLDDAEDPTRFLSLTPAKSVEPIALKVEAVDLPVGVRDLDSFDPSRAGTWLALTSVEFPEGGAVLPDKPDAALIDAVELIGDESAARIAEYSDNDRLTKPSLRVIGYSASDRLSMDGKGLHESNRWLADLRARKVAALLVQLGAPPRKLLVGAAPEAVRGSANKVEILIDY
jgi:hypothetical protein